MNIVIAVIILLAYTIALCIKGGGIPPSLSASVFDLRQNMRWIIQSGLGLMKAAFLLKRKELSWFNKQYV